MECTPVSAADAVKAARAAGVEVRIEGDDLVLEAVARPPTDVVERLARHKLAIVALLRPGRDGWSTADWQAFFDQRAAKAGVDAGLTRTEAEVRAFACCAVEWRNRNSVRSPPGRCLTCGGVEYPHNPLLPFGAEPSGVAWLHSRCWEAWHAGRKASAVAELAAMGIEERRPHP